MINRDLLKCVTENESLTLDPLDGSETLVRFKNCFMDYPTEQDYIGAAHSTPKMPVLVYETLAQWSMYDVFPVHHGLLEGLCLSQHQICHFAAKYPHWLNIYPDHSTAMHMKGENIFFLFKVKNTFLVATTFFIEGKGFTAHVYPFDGFRRETGKKIVLPPLSYF